MQPKKNRSNLNNKNNYYNYTSVAHDYESEYNPKRVKRKIKKIKKDKYIKAEQGLKFLSLRFISVFSLMVIFILSIIFLEALIIQKKFDIEDLNSQLKELTENNKNLEAELAKSLDLEYIEHIASSELGMQKPASHQIRYIEVPKESYSQKGNIEKKETPLLKLYNMFKN